MKTFVPVVIQFSNRIEQYRLTAVEQQFSRARSKKIDNNQNGDKNSK